MGCLLNYGVFTASCYPWSGWQLMETILKPHYIIELPQEICCKLDLMPGTRFEVEVDEKIGRVILTPLTNRHPELHPAPEKNRFHRFHQTR